MVLNDPKTIAVDVVGTISKRKYEGLFRVKPVLSHRDKLRQDEMKRQLVGTNGAAATEDAVYLAACFSKIWAHLVEAPSWWKEAGNGIDLLDEEPVVAVLNKIFEFEKEIYGAISKDGEEAKKALAEAKK